MSINFINNLSEKSTFLATLVYSMRETDLLSPVWGMSATEQHKPVGDVLLHSSLNVNFSNIHKMSFTPDGKTQNPVRTA